MKAFRKYKKEDKWDARNIFLVRVYETMWKQREECKYVTHILKFHDITLKILQSISQKMANQDDFR